MTGRHVALIVEDDAKVAAAEASLLRSLGHDVLFAVTLEDVKSAMARGGFCYVLLDINIPMRAGELPLLTHGVTALRLLRTWRPERSSRGGYALPVEVVTSYANDTDFVDDMFAEGATGFIAKPFGDRVPMILRKLLTHLAIAGRENHAACMALDGATKPVAPAPLNVAPDESAPPQAAVRIDVPGEHAHRRTLVLVNGQECRLQDALFAFLLHAIVQAANRPGAWVERRALGIARSPEIARRARRELAKHVPQGTVILENDRGAGRYRLGAEVTVGTIHWEGLLNHSSGAVRTLAEAERLRKRS